MCLETRTGGDDGLAVEGDVEAEHALLEGHVQVHEPPDQPVVVVDLGCVVLVC